VARQLSPCKQEQAGASRSKQEQAGASRSKQEQAGASRSKQEQAGASRSKQGASRSKQEQAGASRRHIVLSAFSPVHCPPQSTVLSAFSPVPCPPQNIVLSAHYAAVLYFFLTTLEADPGSTWMVNALGDSWQTQVGPLAHAHRGGGTAL